MKSITQTMQAIRPRRLVRPVVRAAVSLVVLAVACGDDPSESEPPPKTPAERVCDGIAAQLQQCGASGACDQSLAADCSELVAVLSTPYLESLAGCLEGGGAPTACLLGALDALAPTAAQHALAQGFCAECAFGIGGCEEVFFSSGDSEYSLGLAFLPFGDEVVAQIQSECATGLGCAATFLTCAQGVITQRAVPEQTMSCMASEILHPSAPLATNCGEGAAPGAGGAAQGGAGPGGAGEGGSGGGNDCVAQCAQSYPAGMAGYEQLLSCGLCGACYDACTAEGEVCPSGFEIGCSSGAASCGECLASLCTLDWDSVTQSWDGVCAPQASACDADADCAGYWTCLNGCP